LFVSFCGPCFNPERKQGLPRLELRKLLLRHKYPAGSLRRVFVFISQVFTPALMAQALSSEQWELFVSLCGSCFIHERKQELATLELRKLMLHNKYPAGSLRRLFAFHRKFSFLR
jgi:hypothetical protein